MGYKPGSCAFRTLVVLLSFQVLYIAWALPLCLNSEAPVSSQSNLTFCSSSAYDRNGCCSLETDNQLRHRFHSMNITNGKCRKYIKQVLCAQCDPFAAALYGSREQQSSPTLCNRDQTSPFNTSSNQEPMHGYCSKIWEVCNNTVITNSPFSPYSLVGIPPSPSSSHFSTALREGETLTDLWQSEKDFCAAFTTPIGAPPSSNFCFNGGPYEFPAAEKPSPPPQGLCLEKVESGSYISLIPHPDGSNRAFLASQSGKVWLATLPEEGSGNPIRLNISSPYLDISDRVVDGGEFGFLAMAFHPNFSSNGRLFVSYNCDKTKWADCAGRCSCNAEVGCDVSQLGNGANSIPCQYSSIISELSANGTLASVSPAEAVSINGREVRRIFTLGLPYTTHHAGQILFGPTDNYLYYMLGDGGSNGDPFNFAQKKKSLLGKILRLDIDNLPTTKEVNDFGFWGNYTVPDSNPFTKDNQSRPEIWALGFRNPWRCSFDSLLPSYFFCADVGQETYEEVNLVTKGGNYGWRIFEGPYLFNASFSPGGTTNLSSVNVIFPILGYPHKAINPVEGASAVIGGYVSRSMQDACIYGRYMYADLYGSSIWAAIEFPLYSGNFTSTKINFTCSSTSPLPCDFVGNSTLPNFQYILSWAQDNNENLYILSYNGVFKVVGPSKCNFACGAKVTPVSPVIASPTASPPSKNPSNGSNITNPKRRYLRLFIFFMCWICISHIWL
ncbi:hypothetical protein O6H91_18G007300 [Diphasiastrum complanatum]|uniref:Uncharacterized protein n=4 Tax=Diphasiastrum complanatum TaxID=34168 RepID=A0ACC2AXT3_DIPCM|nr:hypothetical protein O6H91_18G007300 [Diphasiastrum complanatum]KAJ7522342.1 hypothetical protein O6H91_18G007300 [Diphasiastrum complanatum]KAJ7522343.1 hypothetical protein O6H91_18G007300 [Diphasiastrum complanatum]KAJ7522344.1 hypothetical protein O6H91_18G007300 [Diphasiastrum complanatum]